MSLTLTVGLQQALFEIKFKAAEKKVGNTEPHSMFFVFNMDVVIK